MGGGFGEKSGNPYREWILEINMELICIFRTEAGRVARSWLFWIILALHAAVPFLIGLSLLESRAKGFGYLGWVVPGFILYAQIYHLYHLAAVVLAAAGMEGAARSGAAGFRPDVVSRRRKQYAAKLTVLSLAMWVCVSAQALSTVMAWVVRFGELPVSINLIKMLLTCVYLPLRVLPGIVLMLAITMLIAQYRGRIGTVIIGIAVILAMSLPERTGLGGIWTLDRWMWNAADPKSAFDMWFLMIAHIVLFVALGIMAYGGKGATGESADDARR